MHRRFWTLPKTGVFIGLSFLLVVYLASISGHWRGSLSDHEFRVRLKTIDAPENTHPSINF